MLLTACPDATFVLSGYQVVADKSTDYKGGKCADLKTGRSMRVDGKLSTGVVKASKIEFMKGSDGI